MLGFGLFIGALVVALAVGFRAFREPGVFNWSVLAAGLLAWIATPSIVTGLVGFLVGMTIPPALAMVVLHGKIKQLDAEKALDRKATEERRRVAEERRAIAQAEADRWPTEQLGWTHVTRAKMMHAVGQPLCFFMLSDNRLLIRIVEYRLGETFEAGSEFTLAVKSILSMNVASPRVTKTRTKTVPVAMVETKRRSPVARGVVGGALLGPAGVIIGAASGLNAKTESTIHHETVSENYETTGDTQLIIGTRDPDRPVLKIKFDPPKLADEWMFRIRGAQ